MEIPGMASYSGQPTLTNPLNSQEQLRGRQTQTQAVSETQNTVSAQEQPPTALAVPEAVEQVNESNETVFDRENPGGTIDFTA